MSQHAASLALNRIESALSRLDAAVQRLPAEPIDAGLPARHEQLQSEVRAVLRDLDAIIAAQADGE